MSTTDPTSPKETVVEFPSTCISGSKREDPPKLVVTELEENKFQFQVIGTPIVTGVYKKFNFKRLREETADEKYSEVVIEDGQKEYPEIPHHEDSESIPFKNRVPVMIRVVWYHRIGDDVEILSSRLNEPVIIMTQPETLCVTGRLYLVNTPSEKDTGDPLGEDPPTWVR